MNDWVYDIETYPNVFTIAFEHAEAPLRAAFEISDARNDSAELWDFLNYLHSRFARLIGFNNIGFDYPTIHQFIRMGGKSDAATLYNKAMSIIASEDNAERFTHLVKPDDQFLKQIDLYKIHHFDNNSRRTSLKALEFNMRSDSIEDLPFPVGTILNREQVEVLKRYNAHDVAQTKKFYHHSKEMIAFREELTQKYQRDFINHNDTKIGKDYFVMELEKAGVQVYDFGPKGRTPRQTPRPVINLRDAILPWIRFEQPEFNRILDWLKSQSITETKGVFKKLTATVKGLGFDFGTGGIHASVSSRIIESDDENMIVDLDVASFYPNLAIKNGFYPEHLGMTFCHIYGNLFEQRKQYPKKSAESAMLKLALNGVYGDSNNQFSVFYDPLFTMKITLNGQLLLCLLAENLMKVPGLEVIQANTDGLTVLLPRCNRPMLDEVCAWWQNVTQLVLEDVEYSRMCIRDVNNYLAVSTNGKVKRKGAYEHQAGGWYDSGYNGWNQDASGRVIAKVAEKALVEGAPIRQTVENWPDLFDFFMRVKVPRTSRLYWGDEQIQNTTRYIVTTDGKPLTKVMPPTPKAITEGKTEHRRIGVESGWNVTVCNRVEGRPNYSINFDYYVTEVEKLVMGLK